MKQKKSLSFFIILTTFAVISLAFMFTMLLIYESGNTYFIEPFAVIGTDILNNETSLPAAQGTDTVEELKTDYQNFLFPYDLFFLVLWINAFVLTVYLSLQANKEGIFSFIGYLFLGSLLVLLVTTFLSDFVIWFMTEIFDKVFADSNVNIPIFDFYVNNLGLINLIWWLILITINIIDRSFISNTGRVEE